MAGDREFHLCQVAITYFARFGLSTIVILMTEP